MCELEQNGHDVGQQPDAARGGKPCILPSFHLPHFFVSYYWNLSEWFFGCKINCPINISASAGMIDMEQYNVAKLLQHVAKKRIYVAHLPRRKCVSNYIYVKRNCDYFLITHFALVAICNIKPADKPSQSKVDHAQPTRRIDAMIDPGIFRCSVRYRTHLKFLISWCFFIF